MGQPPVQAEGIQVTVRYFAAARAAAGAESETLVVRPGTTVAELVERLGVSGIADTVIAVKFVAKVVDGLLALVHPGRALTRGERRGDFGTDSGFFGNGDVRVPLRILRPLPRRDENHEFTEFRRQHGLELQVFPQDFGGCHDIRAAQKRQERSAHKRPASL